MTKRMRVKRFRVAVASLVDKGAAPNSDFFMLQHAADGRTTLALAQEHITRIEEAGEISAQMAEIDALADALRDRVSETQPVEQGQVQLELNEVRARCGGWDWWQAFQEAIGEASSRADVLAAVDELAAGLKAELTAPGDADGDEPVGMTVDPSVTSQAAAGAAQGDTPAVPATVAQDAPEPDTEPVAQATEPETPATEPAETETVTETEPSAAEAEEVDEDDDDAPEGAGVVDQSAIDGPSEGQLAEIEIEPETAGRLRQGAPAGLWAGLGLDGLAQSVKGQAEPETAVVDLDAPVTQTASGGDVAELRAQLSQLTQAVAALVAAQGVQPGTPVAPASRQPQADPAPIRQNAPTSPWAGTPLGTLCGF